jgi:hypothetical protein
MLKALFGIAIPQVGDISLARLGENNIGIDLALDAAALGET